MTDSSDSFVAHFRASAPYLHTHRGRTCVILCTGELVDSGHLDRFLHDVAILNILGMRIVLVAGARPQIDEALALRGLPKRYHDGRRITDAATLECVKEATGATRIEIEANFSVGLPSSTMAGSRVRVASGNFVVAKPVGVVNGVDYEFTGEPRRFDTEAINARLNCGEIVLLTPVGYSRTGEVFNMSSLEVASAVAVALEADKLITMVDSDRLPRAGEKMSPTEAVAWRNRDGATDEELRMNIDAALRACSGGVARTHLVPSDSDGALLRELFTRDGVGTLITSQTFEGVRRATRDDIAGILQLIRPLEQLGILVARSEQVLERDVDSFVVVERDGMAIACGALYIFGDDRCAELACLAVDAQYRGTGRGDQLLEYVERLCKQAGVTNLFVLTTKTAHWFQERGFELGSVDMLPVGRRQSYDAARGSKVFVKALAPATTGDP